MSKAKEIISKKIFNQIKSVGKSMPKLFSAGLISLLSALHLSSMPSRGLLVHAQVENHQAIDQWSEALRVAQSKVEAATSPGAFGHGVPDFHTLTTPDLLMVFGVASAGSILVYMIASYLLTRSKEKGLKNDQLIASAA